MFNKLRNMFGPTPPAPHHLDDIAAALTAPANTSTRVGGDNTDTPPHTHTHGCDVILISTGSYCPPHRQHLQKFVQAKKWIEANTTSHVIGGLVSPSHDNYVNRKLGTKAISSPHRLRMLELCIAEMGLQEWLYADPWECTQDHFIDFMNIAAHVAQSVSEHPILRTRSIRVVFLCGADLALNCRLYSPSVPISFQVGILAVGRAQYVNDLKERAARAVEDQRVMMENNPHMFDHEQLVAAGVMTETATDTDTATETETHRESDTRTPEMKVQFYLIEACESATEDSSSTFIRTQFQQVASAVLTEELVSRLTHVVSRSVIEYIYDNGLQTKFMDEERPVE
eukprot:GFYU01000456.1.p1 GENE.GFYU01000456.1~~GFYU01000456.1.p1  ORF type:complete len:341 (+),score=92.41 GFYU01000456.1:82-1104(+)